MNNKYINYNERWKTLHRRWAGTLEGKNPSPPSYLICLIFQKSLLRGNIGIINTRRKFFELIKTNLNNERAWKGTWKYYKMGHFPISTTRHSTQKPVLQDNAPLNSRNIYAIGMKEALLHVFHTFSPRWKRSTRSGVKGIFWRPLVASAIVSWSKTADSNFSWTVGNAKSQAFQRFPR